MAKIPPIGSFEKVSTQAQQAHKALLAKLSTKKGSAVFFPSKYAPKDLKPADEVFRKSSPTVSTAQSATPAVFPELTMPQTTGCHLNVKGQKINLYA